MVTVLRDILLERIEVMQNDCEKYGKLLQRNISLLEQLDETLEKLQQPNK
jgi:hypothetical protein